MIPTRGVLLLAGLLIGCDSKWSFEDGDGDGVSAAEGDCWDSDEGPEGTDLKGSDIFPGAEETWYDGVDQNCNGDDDYDADGDGFIQDIHVGLGTIGNEESGFLNPGDCWDEPVGPLDGLIGGERINPDATDTWYDGIDQDCAGNDDHDADGDGFARVPYSETVPALSAGVVGVARDEDGEILADCSDAPEGEITVSGDSIEGALIYPGSEDIWYDGVDQDCAENNDFDQDGDGYASSVHADLNGDFGADCLDDLDEQDLPVEDSFQWGIDGADLSKQEVLDHYGLAPADFNPDSEDVFYDGFDMNCDLANDCDQDADGWDASGPDAPACGDEPSAPLCSIVACDNVDCDDDDADIMPMAGVVEVFYNGIDDNCNLEDGDGDADGDGFWSSEYATLAPDSDLVPPPGKEGDCNDADPEIAPGLYDEPYDGLDADCVGDDDFDQDRDGYAAEGYDGIPTEHSVDGGPLPGTGLLPGGDCRDLDPLANPGVNEECGTTYDDDCDGDENDEDAEECLDFHADRDADTFGDPADSKCYCEVRGAYSSTPELALDCDDESEVTKPGVAINEEDPSLCMKDADGDGFGDSSLDGPFVAGTDCDDDNGAAHPAAEEDCETDFDDDCDTNTNDEDALGSGVFFADRDEDGFGDAADSKNYCVAEGVYTTTDSTDCDDESDVTKPGVAINEADPSLCMKDADSDGYGEVDVESPVVAGTDCNDVEPDVNPGMAEDCDTDFDDDCDEETNEVDAEECIDFYADRDEDGHGDPSDVQCTCVEMLEYTATVEAADDCDDGSATTYPGAAGEDSSTQCMKDDDGDGYGDVSPPEGVSGGTDCDDDPSAGGAEVNPAQTEDCATEYDDNCNDITNEKDADACTAHFADVDGDGFGDPEDSECYCENKDVYTSVSGDCDDTRPYTFPGAAENEPVETAEDGTAILVCHKDQDEDGYGDIAPPEGVTEGTDCDDENIAANPDPETNEDCSTTFDDDCDGDTNDEDADGSVTFFADRDGDTFGDPEDSRQYCVVRDVYTESDADDCDDTSETTYPGVAINEADPAPCMNDDDGDGYGDNGDDDTGEPPYELGTDCDDDPSSVGADVHPGMTEDCSTAYDDNCDGDTNDVDSIGSVTFFADRDEDGFGDPDDSQKSCVASGIYNESDADDCDDDSATTKPGVAVNESDPSLCMKDDDGDGYGDSSTGSDFAAGTDCDDARSAVNPSVNENCGTAYDDDCNGKSNDEGADSCSDFFADVDGDGFGAGSAKCMCEAEDVYVAPSGDCDDTRDYTFPGAAENEAVSACHKDQDEDGYGDSSPPGGVTAGTDCDDDNSVVNPDPGTEEECSTTYDDNCNGDTNDIGASGSILVYADTDGDTHGGGTGILRCQTTVSHPFTVPTDCDPLDEHTYPGAAEAESGSSCRKDADEDGYGDSDVSGDVIPGNDCDDDDPDQNPGETERCDTAKDDDCSGDDNDLNAIDCDVFFADRDGDNRGDPDDSRCYCEAEGVYKEADSDDCDDTDEFVYLGAAESCDDTDSDCDGSLVDGFTNTDGDSEPNCIDDDDDNDGFDDDDDCDPVDDEIYPDAPESCDLINSDCDEDGDLVDDFVDDDGDGVPDCVVDEDGDGVSLETDCDDTDPTIFPGNVDDETLPGIDNDCDDFIDEDFVLDRLAANQDVLLFSEIQVNPQGGSLIEPKTEWFELTNATDEWLYLDDWVFEMVDTDCVEDPSKCDMFTVFSGSDVQVEPGGAVLFCRVASTMDPIISSSGESCDYNYGSQPAGTDKPTYHDAGFRLKNEAMSRLYVSIDGEEVDFVDHRDSIPPWPLTSFINEGYSLNFDGGLFDTGDDLADENDDGANWCHTTSASYIYDTDVDGAGQHNYGTPGEVNPSCDLADP